MPYDHKTKQLSQVLKSNTWLGNYLKSVRHVESRAAAARSCWSVTSKSLHPDVIKDPMHGSKRKPLNSISEEKRNSKTFLFLVSGRPTYQFNCTAIYRCNILLSTTSTHVRPFSAHALFHVVPRDSHSQACSASSHPRIKMVPKCASVQK